jgi:hypothetical protein
MLNAPNPAAGGGPTVATTTRVNMTLVRASLVFGAALALVLPSAARADDSANCSYLEALNQQYAGVELTPDQKKMKVKLVAWYVRHCHNRREASAIRE